MSSREKFEAWLSSEYQWANDALSEAHFHGDDETGYYTGGDFIYDGKSCSDALFWSWRGWQESHKQGEAKCTALAAENAGLAAEVQSVKAMNDCLSEELRGYESDGAFEGPKIHLLWWKVQTPATDSFLAEVRAQGVDMMVDQCESDIVFIEPEDEEHYTLMIEHAKEFAAQIRKGASA